MSIIEENIIIQKSKKYSNEKIVADKSYIKDLKISTITSTAFIGIPINLCKLFNNVSISDYNIKYIEFNGQKEDINVKGYNERYEKKKRKGLKKKCFDNQITLVFDNEEINMKIFKNGKIQMTGIKTIEYGHKYVDKIINIIKDIYFYDTSIIDDCYNISLIKNFDYKIQLINSDFKIGFSIKREKLYNVLLSNYDNMISSYEPCIYPGVKISYFYNEKNNIKNGICNCSLCNCFTKKNGTGLYENSCKKITIVIFQSGSVIITGSQNLLQLNETYTFIHNLLTKYIDEIKLIKINEKD